jgi:hypothetical protein
VNAALQNGGINRGQAHEGWGLSHPPAGLMTRVCRSGKPSTFPARASREPFLRVA